MLEVDIVGVRGTEFIRGSIQGVNLGLNNPMNIDRPIPN